LDDKYLKTASRESADYKMFSDNTFTMILDLLYKENKYVFPYNPKTIKGGFNSEYYIGKLYKLLNVDYKIYDYNKKDDNMFYSYLNEEFNSLEYSVVRKNIKARIRENRHFKYADENMVAPEVLMVITHDNMAFTKLYKDFFPNAIVNGGETKNNLKSLRENIYYRGAEYNLDSVILENWDTKKGGHAIAGITCKKNKYVYNGWTRSSMDPQMAKIAITRNIPCELMKYEWNIKKHDDFCLNTKTCIPDILKTKEEIKKNRLCFNFSKGRRILVYIRKNVGIETSIENDNIVKRYSKTISRSKSPIYKKAKVAKAAKAKNVIKKSCPEGKVRNPETGRCILIKNAKAAKAKNVIKKLPNKPKVPVADKNAVELSVFTYISKDINFRRTAYYNEMIFVKLGNKVYIEISEGDEQNAPVNEMLDILMPFDELMKNKYLKKYYELSRMAIGKQNIDTNYYRENVNIKRNYHLIDTLYIVEDPLTKIKFAKKGNSYRHFNLAKLKKITVADAYSIEEFNNEYNIRYGVDDKTLDEVVANYTALANQL